MEEDMTKGSLGIVAVVERISGGLPMRGVPPLWWMVP